MDVIIIVLIAIALLGVIAAVTFLGRRGPGDDLPADDDLGGTGGTAVLDRPVAEDDASAVLDEPVDVVDRPAVLERPKLRDRLSKARGAISSALGSAFSRGVDAETWDDLEAALILADVGVETTISVLDAVRDEAKQDGVSDAEGLRAILLAELNGRLEGFDRSMKMTGDPSIWLFVGVNGVGKTTTIGKVAQQRAEDGNSVVLAAGDTFRAAAAEQLGMWAERSGSSIIRGAEGSDPSSVIFDAVEHAASRDVDLVLADTAGRLHTKSNLMDELSKVRRVAEKGSGTVDEVLLVLDATTGQNGLTQARQFTEAVELTGVVLTKLDGSAKGGIVLAIHEELGIPVKLVGVGESIEDLIEFDPTDFVDALFS